MPIEVKQIITAIYALVIMLAIYIAVLFTVYWILSRMFRWLYKMPWFNKLVSYIQVLLQQLYRYVSPQWQQLYKYAIPHINKLWSFISEILIDPIFYGYTVVAVYDKMQALSEYSKNFPQYGFWRILEADVNSDIGFWAAFFAIFTIWFSAKVWKHNQDVGDRRAITSSLESISKTLRKMNNKIDKLSRNIKG